MREEICDRVAKQLSPGDADWNVTADFEKAKSAAFLYGHMLCRNCRNAVGQQHARRVRRPVEPRQNTLN